MEDREVAGFLVLNMVYGIFGQFLKPSVARFFFEDSRGQVPDGPEGSLPLCTFIVEMVAD